MKEAYLVVNDTHYHENPEDDESGELRTECKIGREGDFVIVKYNETVDTENDCETRFIVDNNRVTMMRSGHFRTSMIFENKKRHTCCYETPFGEMMISIYTNAMFVDFDEEGGEIRMAYTIDSAGDLISENDLKITVELKKEEDYVSFGKAGNN